MRNTSPTFAPYAVERDVDCVIRFELLDENANDNAIPSVSEYDIAQLSQLGDGVMTTEKYTSLEPNLWALDGSLVMLPDNLADAQTGWWSRPSDATGTFNPPPELTHYFGGVAISSVGFTLFFDGSAPSLIRITAYAANQTTVIAQDTFANDKSVFVADMPVQNYYKVKFEFLATSEPYRRVRVIERLFGIIQTFNRDSLEAVNITYAADLMGEALPSRRLVFTFDNADHKYNLINPSGIYAYLQEGQNIHATIKVDGESVYMGAFDFTSATASDDEITGQIIGYDYVLSALDDAIVPKQDATKTLANAVADILAGLDISVSMAYPSTNVFMGFPDDTTRREALRLVAQAACCSVWVDRDGVLQIRPLDVGAVDDELTADRMPTMGGISVSEPVDCVKLVVNNQLYFTETVYTAGSGSRVKTIDNPCVSGNGQAVADWLLAQYNRRIRYDKQNRGNPAVEIGDTIKIHDAYGENRDAAVTGIDISFSGNGLSAQTKAVGG